VHRALVRHLLFLDTEVLFGKNGDALEGGYRQILELARRRKLG
jgi:hypothetical protein